MAYQIRQLGLGGILDQSIAIIKDHFGILFKILLMTLVPPTLIFGLGLAMMMPTIPAGPPSPVQQIEFQQGLFWPLTFLVAAISMLIVMPITYGAIIQAVAHLYLGQEITATRSVKDGVRLWVPLVGTAILYALALLGGFILFIIPYFVFLFWFALWANVVVIEGTSGPVALGRSKAIVRGHFLAMVALFVVLWVISNVLVLSANLIPQQHVQVVVSTFIQALTTLFATVCWVVFYFSCRCANESFDLQYLANSIGEQPSADAIAEDAATPRA